MNAHIDATGEREHRWSLLDLAFCILVPLLVGIRALTLGQDTNWDQDNYHLYNGFALWHHKLGIDLAPSGMQTYFNPVLDAFNYALYQALPAPAVGFILGTIHGCCFIPLFIIVRRLCSDTSPAFQRVIAIGGLLTANFLSGIGNSMGDDATALFVLTGVAIFLTRDAMDDTRLGKRLFWTAVAGLFVGVGAGLKLTNAVYCVAFVVAVGVSRLSIRAMLAAGFGGLVGILVGGGYWFAVMYQTFGNPVFPQFGNVFPNPLALTTSVVDSSWWPKTVHDAVFWPFIYTIDPKRVGQVIVREILWPLCYALVIVWASWFAMAKIATRMRAPTPIGRHGRFIVCFVVVGYLVWMKMFSIARYVVPMEVLLPLLAFVLLRSALRFRTAQTIAGTLAVASMAVALVGGAHSWGHAGWTKQAFRLDAPGIADPSHTTVIIEGGPDAHGWMAAMFPDSVAFAQIASSFPATDLFRRRIADLVKNRGGPAYLIALDDGSGPADTAQSRANRLLLGEGLPGIAHCVQKTGYIGTKAYPFQWCRLNAPT
jgi:hypothetical protein